MICSAARVKNLFLIPVVYNNWGQLSYQLIDWVLAGKIWNAQL